MKVMNAKHYLISCIFMGLLCLQACIEDDEPEFIINTDQSKAPKIVSTNSILELSRENQALMAYTLVWDDAAYNLPTPITYTIEAAAAGTNFENPVEAGQTTDRFFSWTIKGINSLAIDAGLEEEVVGTLEFRVWSGIGNSGSEALASTNTISLTMTPYPSIIVQTTLFLVGNATSAGWTPKNTENPNPAMIRDPNNPNLHSIRAFFKGGTVSGSDTENYGFKLLEILGEWQPQWGNNGGSLSVNRVEGGTDPDPITVSSSGYYDIQVDIENNTYSFTPYDATSQTNYDSLGIIGTATANGWDSDTDLIQSSFDPHLWYIQGITLTTGEAKFRTNDSWDTNWGGTNFPSAIGEPNSSGNIPVTSGVYDIWFYDLDGGYHFVVRN